MRTICLDLPYISDRFTIVLYCIVLLCKSSDERTKNETIPAGYAFGRTGREQAAPSELSPVLMADV